MASHTLMMDGNEAAAYISYAFTEVASIFPITPSSQMAEGVDEWASNGKKNLFGQPVKVVEMQSEGGAAGAVHGSLQAGALTSTYTASQGLLLMIPNMYKIAGELLPGVFHVSARTLSSHALSIFGDHSDVMAARSTGFAFLAASSPQEVMDLGAVAHLSAISSRVPFLHFFDGFRTSHEIQKIEVLEYNDLVQFVDWDALNAFRKNSMNPEHPITRGLTVSPDIFFQARESANNYIDSVPEIVESYMRRLSSLTGRSYNLFDYYGSEEADRVIVCMGSVVETVKETIDELISQGEKVGLIQVRLYRPFSVDHFISALPETARKVAVLDRCKEGLATGEPLLLDVCRVCDTNRKGIEVIGGRFGLSSKDTTPAQIAAVYSNLKADRPKDRFTIGINDDVYGTSLPLDDGFHVPSEGVMSCKIWGIGSDGTVGANKNTVKIIGKSTDLQCQAYFVYDSKKAGGLTQSNLRFSPMPIRSPYLVTEADFVACHKSSYIHQYDLVDDLKPGGSFLLNCKWTGEDLESKLPVEMKRQLAEKKASFYVIDADAIAKNLGMTGRINTILQAAFFKLTNTLPIEVAITQMENAVRETYKKKGETVIESNIQAIRLGLSEIKCVEIPDSWNVENSLKESALEQPEFIRQVVVPIQRQKGDTLPVSIFTKYKLFDGSWPNGTTQYEKRGTAADVPQWNANQCLQCNQCALVCPHAAIRPVLLTEEENNIVLESFETIQASGTALRRYRYRMQVSPLDCTGCGSCVNVCPAKEKALVLYPLETQLQQAKNWEYVNESVTIKKDACGNSSVRISQFAKPYFEFPGACAGCGETPYIKLLTQLFGDRMFIANASGCSSAYSGSTPSTPYTRDNRGRGPTWAMSLFEDNAEYMFGLYLGYQAVHMQLRDKISILLQAGTAVEECSRYLESVNDVEDSETASTALVEALVGISGTGQDAELAKYVVMKKEYLTKKSFWALGGDGWAYDIGYGGLDHVLASGNDVNILVLDTEVYSNTGGQASKATSTAAIAKFASGGKITKKKDLGLLAMCYGDIYVAQVAMGYDQAQTLCALREAEAYPGPSIIIAYCPCIEHGIQIGMGRSQEEMKHAVESGYWHLYRYNPMLKKEEKNPFILDSKPPVGNIRDFLRKENRFASLELLYPEKAEELYQKAAIDAMERYTRYCKMAADKFM